MKIKSLFCVLFALLLISYSQADQDEEYGFTGEFAEIELEQIPAYLPSELVIQDEENVELMPLAAASKKVKALMIGIRKYDPPDDPDWEIYYFYSYHWPGHNNWWLGFVVVNFDDKSVPIEITMEMKGPKTFTLKKKRKIGKNKAMLYIAKVKLESVTGLYQLKGKVSGDQVQNNQVSTRFFIYEIW